MTEKDRELLSTLFKGTEGGRIEWTPTAEENEFTASFKGNSTPESAELVLIPSVLKWWTH